jgi:hypothetical protein
LETWAREEGRRILLSLAHENQMRSQWREPDADSYLHSHLWPSNNTWSQKHDVFQEAMAERQNVRSLRVLMVLMDIALPNRGLRPLASTCLSIAPINTGTMYVDTAELFRIQKSKTHSYNRFCVLIDADNSIHRHKGLPAKASRQRASAANVDV